MFSNTVCCFSATSAHRASTNPKHPSKYRAGQRARQESRSEIMLGLFPQRTGAFPLFLAGSCFSLALFFAPLLQRPPLLGVFLNEGEGTCLCAHVTCLQSYGSSSQQSAESSRKRPLLFYSGSMSARVRQQRSHRTARSISQPWPEASMGAGKGAR